MTVEKEADFTPCRPAPLPPSYKRRICVVAPSFWHNNDITFQQRYPTPNPLVQDFQNDQMAPAIFQNEHVEPQLDGCIVNEYHSEKSLPLMLEQKPRPQFGTSPRVDFHAQMEEKKAKLQRAKANFLKSMDELSDKLVLVKVDESPST